MSKALSPKPKLQIQLCLDMPRNAEAAEAAQHTQHCSPWQPFHNAKDRRWVLTNPPDPSKYVWYASRSRSFADRCDNL